MARSAPNGNDMWAYFVLMRPSQWSKNLLVFLAPFFDGRLSEVIARPDIWIVLLVFCLAASAVYSLNDAQDAESDRLHPHKSQRPVAIGRITPFRARLAFALLGVASLGICFLISSPFPILICCALYLLSGTVYSLWAKKFLGVDSALVSLGFLLRIAAGGFAATVTNSSPWLYVCAFLMALLISVGKRHSELMALGKDAPKHRSSLEGIRGEALTRIIWICGFGLATAYVLYAFFADTRIVPGVWPWATTPLAIYLVGYYLRIVLVDHDAERPHLLWYRRKPMLIGLLGYFSVATYLIYFQV